MSTVNTISTAELDARLRENGKLHFWNVLTDEYFNGELIPGSRRVPLERVGREAVPAERLCGREAPDARLHERQGLRGRAGGVEGTRPRGRAHGRTGRSVR